MGASNPESALSFRNKGCVAGKSCPAEAWCEQLGIKAAMWPYRPRLIDMAEHPEGFLVEREQALLVICSTQVPPTSPFHASRPGLTVCVWMNA